MWYMSLFWCKRRHRWILVSIWNEKNGVVHSRKHMRRPASTKLPKMVAKIPKLWQLIAFRPGVKAKRVIADLVHQFQV
jgi:hypothetical protein